jgi:hypothetical protein
MTEYRAEDLDCERLASLLLTIPMTSNGLRHTSLKSSLDYMHGDRPELAYIRDFLTLGTQEIIDKWFGGQDTASRTHDELVGQVILGMRGA